MSLLGWIWIAFVIWGWWKLARPAFDWRYMRGEDWFIFVLSVVFAFVVAATPFGLAADARRQAHVRATCRNTGETVQRMHFLVVGKSTIPQWHTKQIWECPDGSREEID